MKIYREQLRPVLQAYTRYYNEIFSDAVPSDDWRKECARSYNSRVTDTIREDDLLTTEEVRLLLKDFDELPARENASMISMLDGPLSHPKWQTLIELVDEYPKKAELIFTHLFHNKRSLENRLRFFMDEFNKDTFNSVGAQIEDGTRSVSPSPLFGIPTTLLMFAYPDRYVSYQFRWFRKFFESYTDYTVHNASSADLVAQYIDLDAGVQQIKQELDPMLNSCNMIDVRNVIRNYEDLEEYTRSHEDTKKEDRSTLLEDGCARTKNGALSTEKTEIDPCPLTELYEAFRGVRTALLMTFRSDASDINEDDLNQPVVQYEKILAAFVGKTDTGEKEILGYGPQHVERVEHKVAEYREQYGNGEWITDYRCIDVEPLRENTRQTLSSHNLVEYPSLLMKPITPHTELPVPELVTTDGDLSRALSILARFPNKPPTDADKNASSDRFPVRDIYKATLAEADVEPVDVNFQTIRQHSQSQCSPPDTTPHWESSPAALASPVTKSEVDDFLAQYGRLTHLFRWIVPPEDTEVDCPIPVFALDFYDPVGQSKDSSKHSYRILSYAKNEEDRFRGYFLNRIRDFVYRRLLKDTVNYDYITVFPGHKAHSLSPSLVELAKQATVETPIVYSELLERIETTEKQSQQDAESRWNVARDPDRTLRVRHQLTDNRVIVLDDVSTTGASLAAASHLLRKAGATEVIGLALGLTRSHSHNDTREIKRREDAASDIIERNNEF